MKKSILILLLVLATSFLSFGHTQEVRRHRESTTSWENLPTESFLSFKDWKEEIDSQMRTPNWEKVKKERNYRELVGRLYQCVGICRIDRGDGSFNGAHRTGILEGDEFQTVGDSYAWIFLFDGTMVRLSPHSSVTFNEFNVGEKENFVSARVNAGNVLWLSRQTENYVVNNLRETDVIFFPYAVYESIPVSDTKEYIESDLFELLSERKTQAYQYETLNHKISGNNAWIKNKPTYAFIVLPNATIMGYSPNVEMVSILGGNSYIKKRSLDTLGLAKTENLVPDLQLQLRGFDNKELQTIKEDIWIDVDSRGRSVTDATETHWLNVGEFITRRIPSLMLGREIFLSEFSEFAFREKYDEKVLAKKDGYLLWGPLTSTEGKEKSALELRLEFLKEYFRRIETSNLVTNTRFRERLQARGESASSMEYGNYFFSTALNRYYQYGEKLRENSSDKEIQEVLNSHNKLLWKKRHGIR